MKLVKLKDCCGAGITTPGVKAGVVEGCKLLGLESRNGRRYSPEAVAKALPMYEGSPVFLDHSEEGQPRKFMEKFGFFKNVNIDETGCPKGDFHYNPDHPAAKTFEGWLRKDPSQVGFSHNAVGRVREDEDGTLVVEEIVKVESVDLVASPATTKGLFEHTAVKEMDGPEALLMPGGGDPGGDLAMKLGQLIAAILTDPGLSPDDKKAKVIQAVELIDGVGGEGAGAGEGQPGMDTPDAGKKPCEGEDCDKEGGEGGGKPFGKEGGKEEKEGDDGGDGPPKKKKEPEETEESIMAQIDMDALAAKIADRLREDVNRQLRERLAEEPKSAPPARKSGPELTVDQFLADYTKKKGA